MILAVKCDRPQFKSVYFSTGFNVVLADRTSHASDKESRNGLGKTTLLSIISFCLGATLTKAMSIAKPAIEGWTFSIDVVLRGGKYTIYRNTADASVVQIEGDFSSWPIRPTPNVGFLPTMKIQPWKDVLGWLIFELPVDHSGLKYTPTFRSLISYFIRIGREAYTTPFEHNRKQIEWDKQVNTAFLLGLGWQYASRWQSLKDREGELRVLKKFARQGLPASASGQSLGELEAKQIRLQDQIGKDLQELSEFKVLAQYEEVQRRADEATSEIQQLSDANFFDQRMIDFYRQSDEEEIVDDSLVERVYAEAGVIFPETLVKRLEDVNEFHRQVTANRREFLASEIHRLQAAIAQRRETLTRLENERSELMSTLQRHGALGQYMELQQRHVGLVTQLREVDTQIENMSRFDSERTAIRISKDQLLLDAKADHHERRPIRQRAISIFNENSQALYERGGSLILDVRDNCFHFDVDIPRSTSDGVKQIGTVYTYDITLAQLWAEKHAGPGFLIHDSAIFDGVDERQKAAALKLALKRSAESEFQYICCLNSDEIPYRDLDFDLNEYVRLNLKDGSPEGGLMGEQF